MSKKKPKKKEQLKKLPVKVRKRQFVPIEPDKTKADQGKLLTDEHRIRGDKKLVEQAIAKGWNIKGSVKRLMRERAVAIANKTTGEIVTKEGVIDSETKGDELALKAIDLLIKMDQSDVKRVETMKDKQPATTVNILNQQTNNVTAIDSKQAELIELAKSFGASKLDINGRTVDIKQGGSTGNNHSDS